VGTGQIPTTQEAAQMSINWSGRRPTARPDDLMWPATTIDLYTQSPMEQRIATSKRWVA
jgi:hypothetical protein